MTDSATLREQVIEVLATASLRGTLGLFIGSGFSKALTKDTDTPAPGWGELLRRVAERVGVTMPAADAAYGSSFPRIASQLVEALAAKVAAEHDPTHDVLEQGALMQRAEARFKETVARECYFSPEETLRAQWQGAIESVSPAWVVTTNYDTLVEELLPNSDVLLPDQVMPLARSVITPVFHLHGHRLAPESLVVTEEDYTRLLRPGEYRQIKLSLLFSETITLVLGYGLGDVNVLSAVDLARGYGNGARHATGIVQALWKASPTEEPYPGKVGEAVVEISGIAEFLTEIGEKRKTLEAAAGDARGKVSELLSDQAVRDVFANDQSVRGEYLLAMRRHAEISGNLDVLRVLDLILGEVWNRAQHGVDGFPVYATFLEIVLDGFDVFGNEGTHPSLFSLLAEKFSNVAYYVTPSGARKVGDSWKATMLWQARKSQISNGLRRELTRWADERRDVWLSRLLRP